MPQLKNKAVIVYETTSGSTATRQKTARDPRRSPGASRCENAAVTRGLPLPAQSAGRTRQSRSSPLTGPRLTAALILDG